MANINIDFTKTVGKIKPMHAVGQPPMLGISDSMFHYLTEIGAPYSRLHDVGGMYASYKWVDVPNIFRDFDADENDPASYDFAFTDIIINALIKDFDFIPETIAETTPAIKKVAATMIMV